VPILYFILVIILLAIGMWFINTQLQIPTSLKNALNILVAILVVVWLVTILFPNVWGLRVGHP